MLYDQGKLLCSSLGNQFSQPFKAVNSFSNVSLNTMYSVLGDSCLMACHRQYDYAKYTDCSLSESSTVMCSCRVVARERPE